MLAASGFMWLFIVVVSSSSTLLFRHVYRPLARATLHQLRTCSIFWVFSLHTRQVESSSSSFGKTSPWRKHVISLTYYETQPQRRHIQMSLHSFFPVCLLWLSNGFYEPFAFLLALYFLNDTISVLFGWSRGPSLNASHSQSRFPGLSEPKKFLWKLGFLSPHL